jgi:hypothetical protein
MTTLSHAVAEGEKIRLAELAKKKAKTGISREDAVAGIYAEKKAKSGTSTQTHEYKPKPKQQER